MTSKTILIFGYYGQNNLGDDLFETILNNWIGNHTLLFVNPLDITELPEADMILVGGGDLVNDYFIPKIKTLIEGKTIPIYGIGLGFPFPNLITKEYLEFFDYIVTRTSSAIQPLIEAMPNRISYCPDLVRDLYLKKSEPSFPCSPGCKRRKIGVFLSSFMCSTYGVVFNKIVTFIKKIAQISQSCPKCMKLYDISLYSMNTSEGIEDDTNLNRSICSKVKMPNVRLVTGKFDVNIFSTFYATICNRFHAHILSLNANVPFVSIYSTTKVKDLLETEGLLDYGVEMSVDSDTLAPVNFDDSKMLGNFVKLVDNYQKLSSRQKVNMEPSKYIIQNLVYYAPKFINQPVEPILRKIGKYLRVRSLNNLDIKDADRIAKVTTFAIARTETQSYTWGLAENIRNGQNIVDAVSWIIQNNPKPQPYIESMIPFEKRKYNFEYFDQDLLAGLHRSGWQYVVEHMKMYHNPNGIIFDSYLDKTFGWNLDFHVATGVLPIRKPWTGVFHHTPDVEYDKNNLTSIINLDVFKKSLKYCTGLIVLSKYLRDWLSQYVSVPIKVAYHPTELIVPAWEMEKWTENKDKKIVQVGAWMRDPFGIYSLTPPKGIRKCALKGKQMNNYYPSETFLSDFKSTLCKCATVTPTCCICRQSTNKFIVGLYDDIEDRLKKVEMIDTLENEDYDDLLNQNIVFIKLVDASACNTIIECIARNTPILVNRLPAVIEYLGENYPLYYESLDDIHSLVTDQNLSKASLYLRNMDKRFLQIDTFTSTIFD